MEVRATEEAVDAAVVVATAAPAATAAATMVDEEVVEAEVAVAAATEVIVTTTTEEVVVAAGAVPQAAIASVEAIWVAAVAGDLAVIVLLTRSSTQLTKAPHMALATADMAVVAVEASEAIEAAMETVVIAETWVAIAALTEVDAVVMATRRCRVKTILQANLVHHLSRPNHAKFVPFMLAT